MEDKNIKKVSVVMCTYNGEKYLREQLDSILNQTYPIYEIIIQDDASTDRTWEIIQRYKKKFPIIKSFRNEKNIGYSFNFRKALFRSSGDYIALSDQDDIWLPNKIEMQLNKIKDKLLSVSQSIIINQDGKETESFKVYNPYISIEELIFHHAISGHQCMINRKMLSYISRIDVEIAHDYMISLIGYAFSSVAITTNIGQKWRRHTSTSTGTFKIIEINNWLKKIKGHKILYTLYCLILNKKSPVIKNAYYKINGVLSSLEGELGVTPHINILCKLTSDLSKQTVLSYTRASFYCWKLRNEIFKRKTKGLKNKMAIFVFVFVHWYNHRFDM